MKVILQGLKSNLLIVQGYGADDTVVQGFVTLTPGRGALTPTAGRRGETPTSGRGTETLTGARLK
jgi:hypothetical protein